MAESQQPKSPPQINIKLSPSGQLNYEGELNQESALILLKLLEQAEYYRAKSKESESEKQQARQQIDSITMVFVGCLFTLVVFLTYQAVSSISHFFTQQNQPVSTSYRIYEP